MAEADDTPSPTTVTLPSAQLCRPPVVTRVGRYELGEPIGEGGMGIVYRAVDPELRRPLAIKLVHEQRTGGERVLREAQAMARLRHPNVVPVFDVGVQGERVYIVMPLLDGGTLGDWLRGGKRTWRAVVERFIAAGRGLAAAHAVDLVHRDFKPDNVLLGRDGEVQVADFGIARLADMDVRSAEGDASSAGVTRAGALLGTPAYMAPEQIDGAVVGPAADQYSFCVGLYEGVYGERPFDVTLDGPVDVSSVRAALRAARRPVAPTGPAPRWLRAAIQRGLREDPAARWPSLVALIAELERGLRRRRRFLGVGLAAAAVAVSASIVLASRPTTRAPAVWRERPLTFRSDVRSASLSPDGESVAFYTGGEILVMPVAGGEPRTVARGIAPDLSAPHLSWRPDGRSLLVTTFDSRASRRDLWSIDLATGERRSLGEARSGEQHMLGDEVISGHQITRRVMIGPPGAPPRFTCDIEGDYAWLWRTTVLGTVVHVTMETRAGERALLATDATCKAPELVVPPLAAMDIIPHADGRFFAAMQGEPPTAVEVDRRGQPRGIARPLPLGTSQVIGVRRDGGFVVLRSVVTWRLVERSASGSRELGRGVGDTVVELAPDRTHLAVIDHRPGEDPALYVTTLDAPEARTRRLVPWARQVAWSPDSARLAATVVEGKRVTLVVVDRASGEVHELDADDISPDAEPAWLDDRRIAYNRGDHRAYRWIDRVDGTVGELIDPAPGWPFELARSPAGDDLALFWNREPEQGVWLLPATGAPRVVHVAAAQQTPVHAWAPDGTSLWVSDGRTVERIDTTTGTASGTTSGAPTRFATPELDRTSRVEDIAVLADDRVLLHVVTVTSDLVLAGP